MADRKMTPAQEILARFKRGPDSEPKEGDEEPEEFGAEKLIALCADLMEALGVSPSFGEPGSAVESRIREETRRAKAKIVAGIVRQIFEELEEEPHEEYGSAGEGEKEED